jgi:hypothetical protein
MFDFIFLLCACALLLYKLWGVLGKRTNIKFGVNGKTDKAKNNNTVDLQNLKIETVISDPSLQSVDQQKLIVLTKDLAARAWSAFSHGRVEEIAELCINSVCINMSKKIELYDVRPSLVRFITTHVKTLYKKDNQVLADIAFVSEITDGKRISKRIETWTFISKTNELDSSSASFLSQDNWLIEHSSAF